MKAYINIVESVLAFIMLVGFVAWIFASNSITAGEENLIKFQRASTTLTILLRSGAMDKYFVERDINDIAGWLSRNLAPLKTGVRITYVKESVELANTSATLNTTGAYDKMFLILLNPSGTRCNVTAESTISFTFSDVAVVDLSNEISQLTKVVVVCNDPTWVILRSEREYADNGYDEISIKENVERISIPYVINSDAMGEMELVVS